MNKLFLPGTFIIIAFLAIACSSGGDVIMPSPGSENLSADSYSSFPIEVSDWSDDGAPIGGTGILGIYQAHIDLQTLNGEFTSLRSSYLTDVLEVVDITGFLSVSPCNDCVKLESVEFNEFGEVVLHVAIKHPFPMGNPSLPPTGANRADLIVYNIEGIIVSDGTGTFSALSQTVPLMNLKNADGYTSYLDASLDAILKTNSTIHPYILHFDDYTTGNYNPGSYPNTGFPPPPQIPTGNLVMGQGSDFNSQDYVFNFTGNTSLDFIYAVGCSYGIASAAKKDRFTPQARVPQHNKKAASEVKVEIESNNMVAGLPTSSAILDIKVLDMNHGVSVGTAINQMLSASNVSSISVMVPDVTSAPVAVNNPTPTGGDPRDPSNPLVFKITITNSDNGPAGDYYGLVKVKDSYNPGQNTNALLEGKDGIKRVKPTESPLSGLFAISEFATYQVFEIGVGFGCGPITGQILNPTCPITTFVSGDTQDFEVTASSANGGDPIVLYEMDYNYNGTTFTSDASNTDGIFNDTGPYVNPNCGGSGNPVTIKVAFRAKDSCTPPNITIFATCNITIDVCITPRYLYEPDPDRTGLSISDPTLDWPVDPAGELDIGVCDAESHSDYDGVYMFEGSEYQQVVRFDHDYTNSIFQAPGLLPANSTGTHPNPDVSMPGYRLDVASNGYLITSYYDMNETYIIDPPYPPFTDPLPEGDLWVFWKPIEPRPPAFPPFPHDPFLGLLCIDNVPAGEEHPLENPIGHEGWDESNYITVSSPAIGDPKGPNPYTQDPNALSVMFRYTNPVYRDATYGYSFVYYGFYPPYYIPPTFFALYDYAWELMGLSSDEIKGVDRSDKDWLCFVVSGPTTQAAWSSGSSENIFLFDSNDPGAPGWYMDLNTALGLTSSDHVLDVEYVPYNDDDPIVFDDGSGGEAPQFAAIAAVLYSNKHIYLLAFDETPGLEGFYLYQDIDYTSSITGTPKHLDVGEATMDIHVTSTNTTTAYVTVFTLTQQP